MKRTYFYVGVFIALPLLTFGQQGIAPQCLPPLLQVGDTTLNNSYLWHAPYYLDALQDQHDLCETGVDLSIRAENACGGLLHFRYQLLLDLDGDTNFETLIDSDSLSTNGQIYFGNNDGDTSRMKVCFNAEKLFCAYHH